MSQAVSARPYSSQKTLTSLLARFHQLPGDQRRLPEQSHAIAVAHRRGTRRRSIASRNRLEVNSEYAMPR